MRTRVRTLTLRAGFSSWAATRAVRTRLGFVVRCSALIALGILGCACGSTGEHESYSEELDDSGYCLIARTTQDSSGSPTDAFFGSELEARTGQRLLLVAVDANPYGDVLDSGADFEPTIVGAGSVFGTTYGLGDLKIIDATVLADGRYHFEVHDKQGRARVFRATLDVTHNSPSCMLIKACYRAVGPSCGGVSIVAPPELLADGTRRLWVTPGSQLHDSCCLQHPHGVHCGGNDSDRACGAEWNRAWYDSKHSATWWHTYDPTQIEYQVDRSAETTGTYPYKGQNVAVGRPLSYWGWYPPDGAWVDAKDAAAWCPKGTSGTTSLTGYTECSY
jgi:hypothetical protein